MSAQTVDFQQVKLAASVDHVIRYLGLVLKQHGDTWRGKCHLCKASDDRALVITTSKRLFHCFKCKEGGDMLKLVAVSKGLPIRDAAIELAKFCGVELVPSGNSSHGIRRNWFRNSSPQPGTKGIRRREICGGSRPLARCA